MSRRMTGRPLRLGGMGLALVGSAALVFVASACAPSKRRPAERAVVEVMVGDKGEEKKNLISETDYRRELARVRVAREGTMNAPPLSLELKQAILDAMIDRRLVMMQAADKGVKASTVAVARELAEMRRALPPKDFEKRLIQTYQSEAELAATVEEILTSSMLMKSEAYASVQVTDADARRLFDEMPENEKVHAARVHAAQIVVQTEEEGRAVLSALKKGKSFEEVARTRSIAPEAVRGGDLGWFEAGVMPSVFDDVCFSLKPGQVSELTASEYGYHVFKVIEAEPERPLTFEEARPKLLEKLREERYRTAEKDYLEGLRSRVKILKNEELIASIE